MDKEKILLIFVMSLVITVVITLFKALPEKDRSLTSSNFGGTFTLTNHLGETVTEKNFDDQYRLIYFGFTYCPAVCPTELQRIASILKELGEEGKKIQPIFVTVDPERDTVDSMKIYVEMFHPRLVGLTGTQSQIDVIKKSYNIYSEKVQDETMTEYTVDHSSYIYFMGPDNNLLHMFKTNDSIEYMVKTIKESL